ncbi:MAG TPA: GNAT family protein [Gemmatimonadaceae bacterium]|nr:GNAT family protein [Gemmatimonadaceae bacterium]
MTATSARFPIDCGPCALRPWRLDDAEALADVANEREIWMQLRDRFPHPYTRAHADGWVQHAVTQQQPTDLAIAVDGRAAGGIGITLGSDIERVNAEIGYWLGKRYWGRGIVSAALRAMTRYAIEEFSLTRVFAIPFVENAGSIRVLEKAGYVREGLMKQSAIKDGVVRDQYLYAYYA